MIEWTDTTRPRLAGHYGLDESVVERRIKRHDKTEGNDQDGREVWMLRQREQTQRDRKTCHPHDHNAAAPANRRKIGQVRRGRG